jgi:hypothetical protein
MPIEQCKHSDIFFDSRFDRPGSFGRRSTEISLPIRRDAISSIEHTAVTGMHRSLPKSAQLSYDEVQVDSAPATDCFSADQHQSIEVMFCPNSSSPITL